MPHTLDRKCAGDFSLRSVYQDIVNIQEVAARLDVSAPVVETMMSIYETAIDKGFSEESKSSLVKVHEERFGQEVRHGAAEKSDEA